MINQADEIIYSLGSDIFLDVGYCMRKNMEIVSSSPLFSNVSFFTYAARQ